MGNTEYRLSAPLYSDDFFNFTGISFSAEGCQASIWSRSPPACESEYPIKKNGHPQLRGRPFECTFLLEKRLLT
jgi:hypothetical protein